MTDRDQHPARIFICYRRAESDWPAGWLYARLSEHFAETEIFKDVDSIELGDDFVASIVSAVESCDVLIAIIGPRWLTLEDDGGRRRLDDSGDYVRIELETALRRGIRVIPVLVDGATMPVAKVLPASLAELARKQAMELTAGSFKHDATRLIRVLERSITQIQARRQAKLESAESKARGPAHPAYQTSITRRTPACVVIMVDQSEAMARPWAGHEETLAGLAARMANDMLLELCVASMPRSGEWRHYFDAGVFGYRTRPGAAGVLESLLRPAGIKANLVAILEIATHPLRLDKRPEGDSVVTHPVWVESGYGHGRPTCQAMAEIGQYAYEWAATHVDSFPPVIINITGGVPTDSPYDGADFREWAERLAGVATRHGSALLFNVLLTPGGKELARFPESADALPPPAAEIFAMSSLLPGPLASGAEARPGARMMSINTGPGVLDIFRRGLDQPSMDQLPGE
jgi:hypothetical protein